MKLNRRSFIAASAATVIASQAKFPAAFRDANSRIGVCTIGFNGQGGSHIKDILQMKDEAEYVALCDVDADVLERGAKYIEKRSRQKAADCIATCARRSPTRKCDAVTIATPNHWHALATIWACQAGKDVYVEKPLSHNIFEGRQVVAAAEKYGRIVQHGTQNRANSHAHSRHEVDPRRLHRRNRRVARLRVQERQSWCDRPRQAGACAEESGLGAVARTVARS